MLTPLLAALIFAFTMWLGLYLIARDHTKPLLVYTGLGLVGYAAGLAVSSILSFASADLVPLQSALLFIPALCWFGAALHLLPDETLPDKLLKWAPYTLVLLWVLIYLVMHGSSVSALYGGLSAVVAALLLVAVAFVAYRLWRERRKRWWALLFVLTLFFTLGAALLLFPLHFISFDLALLTVGADLLFLDFCIAGLDAFDEGETLLPDASYSFVRAMLVALIFGGQVVLASGQSLTAAMLALLFGVIAAAIASQVFSEAIQTGLDRLVFARFPRLRLARAELRTAASVLPRADDTLDLRTIPEDEFARLTRRALSHMTDTGKLAASPLMRLPILDARAGNAHTLERATQLKRLLTESIQRLKPLDKGNYGVFDEWRFYNVLYYPYVEGIKLLSMNRADHFDSETRAVVDWFRVNVPERTLHNWQNAAARLVAQDLRDQMR